MKILLFGKTGKIGWELQRALDPLGEVYAPERGAANALCGDLFNLDSIAATVRLLRPQVIVNAAAYTAVDAAESNPELARTINAAAPGVMAREAQACDAWLVHYSTDYVFDGHGSTPWQEDDCTGPLNVYGKTKLEGEKAVVASGCNHLIFRTSWVYGSHGNDFTKTMLRLGQEHDRLTVVDDQVGAPTGADLIADITAHAMRFAIENPSTSGTYHLAASGETSWHAYAVYVLDAARRAGAKIRVQTDAIIPVPSKAVPTVCHRPHNSRLATRKIRETFGLNFPIWQAGVNRFLMEMLGRQL